MSGVMTSLARDVTAVGSGAYVNAACPACAGKSANYFETTGHDGKKYWIDACTRCSFVYVRNVPSDEQLRDIYRSLYGTGAAFVPDTRFHKRFKNWFFAKRIKALTRPGRRRVLEVGCAHGHLLRALQTAGIFEFEGIDYSEGSLEHLRSSGMKVSLASLEEKNYPDESFDLVVGFHVLEHVQEPNRFAREVHRILSPGGKFYLQVPCVTHWRARQAGKAWKAFGPPAHLWYFSPQAMRHFLSNNGFRVISAHTISNRTHLTVVAERI